MNITGPLTSFGEILSSKLKKLIDLKFTSGLTPEKTFEINKNGGNVTYENGTVVLNTSAVTNSICNIESKTIAVYYPGTAIEAKFTALFSEGVSGTKQLIGIGDAENGFFFGYIGSDFGIIRRYGGAVEVRELIITTKPSVAGDITITLNGESINITVSNTDEIVDVVKLITNQDFSTIGGGWKIVKNVDRIYFISILAETRGGSYSFSGGSTGTVATGPTLILEGSSPTEIFTDQSSWNTDNANGDTILPVLNKNKGNVYKIVYQWLGYGSINFFIENSENGKYVKVHSIKYSNANDDPTIYQPNLPFTILVDNLSTTSNLSLKCASASVDIQGEGKISEIKKYHTHSIEIGTAEEVIFILRVKQTTAINTLNRNTISIFDLTFGNNAGKPSQFKIYKNPDIGGVTVPSWNNIDSNSMVEYMNMADSSNFSIDTGNPIYATFIGSNQGERIELTYPVTLTNYDVLVVTGVVTSGSTSDLHAGILWLENY